MTVGADNGFDLGKRDSNEWLFGSFDPQSVLVDACRGALGGEGKRSWRSFAFRPARWRRAAR